MAAIGLYGVRMAPGASPGKVVGLVVRRSLLLTGTGIVMGSVMAIAGMRLLRSFLFTGPGRPLVLLGVAAADAGNRAGGGRLAGLAGSPHRSGGGVAGRISQDCQPTGTIFLRHEVVGERCVVRVTGRL
jgi:ABC-type antimicrobial peptide transport system permease subunit